MDGTRTGWEHFPHGADIGVRGFGPSRSIAFGEAAKALGAIVGEAEPSALQPVTLHCEAPDDGLLLVDWLNALVFEMASRRLVFVRFDLTLHDHALDAVAWGAPLRAAPDAAGVEVKGATYTALSVTQEPAGGWVAQCVVDV